jgi:phenylalanyl-tRNA synthetase beta chain
MKVLYSWLKELVPCDLSVEEMAQGLTMQGLNVEGIEYLGEGLEDIVVGQIETYEKHPNADRLSFCQVTDGEDAHPIVCGATNHKQGDKVALALPGTKLPAFEGKALKKTKIRGVESRGMMCSERELGLSDEHAGIIILPEDAPVGQSFVEAAGLHDWIIEFENLANRGDCLSALGIARELAAMVDSEVKMPEWSVHPGKDEAPSFTIETLDYDLCPRYCARVIEGVKIGPSPEWMQRRLKACGIRCINNIVDISNYVLLEFGHPLHAFDLETLKGRKIIVRRARPGEKITTIDDVERPLSEENLVIADAERPVALAGVMGGAETEVSEGTVNLLIESAYFDPISIRKTSRKTGLSTEASYRFERGADWKGLVWACERCTRLIQELAEGQVAGELIDIQPDSGPHKLEEQSAELRAGRVNQVLGIHLNSSETSEILQRLGFDCRDKGDEIIEVSIPPWRGDVTREIDLIEEVARIYGYNRVAGEVPRTQGRVHQKAWRDSFIEQARAQMVSLGYLECWNSAIIGPAHLDRIRAAEDSPLRQAVKLMNPLSENESLMRTTLAPSIIEALSVNARRLNPRVALFELARVYMDSTGNTERHERRVLAGGGYGPRGQQWPAQEGEYDFFDAKGALEAMLAFAGVSEYRFEAAEIPYLQTGRSAKLVLGDSEAGVCGELHPDVAEDYEIRHRAAIFELDMEVLRRTARSEDIRFEAPSLYPPVTRDLALVVDLQVHAADLQAGVEKAAGKLLEKCYLYDVFTGGRIPAGKRSLNYRLVFRAPDRTLKEEDVNKQQDRILRTVKKEFNAELPM